MRRAPSAADEKLSVEELQRRARENWLALKAQQPDKAFPSRSSSTELGSAGASINNQWRGRVGGGVRLSETRVRAQERENPSDHGIDDDLTL